ncbi:hypothetical protein QTP88_022376 [Uroleucon formosanum]
MSGEGLDGSKYLTDAQQKLQYDIIRRSIVEASTDETDEIANKETQNNRGERSPSRNSTTGESNNAQSRIVLSSELEQGYSQRREPFAGLDRISVSNNGSTPTRCQLYY